MKNRSMLSRMGWWVALCVSVVFAQSSYAENAAKQPFSFEFHSQAEPFDGSGVVESVRGYIVGLGKYKKRKNIWSPVDSLRLNGDVERYTLELPRGLVEKEVFDFYREQLPAESTLLFECKKRKCGESNNWANDHFGVKQLYGLDESQYYAVYQITQEQFTRYITIYTVRRGNRRLYTQLELLKVEK